MASDELRVINQMLDGFDLSEGTIEERRARMENLGGAAPDGVAWEEVDAGGVVAEWIVAPEASNDRVLLYLHGGGYTMGSRATHRVLVSRLSEQARARVLSVDYRLAPEHSYPAAVDDAVAAYRWLLAQGVAADRIAIAGDSAGGGLTLATLLALRDAGDPLPAAAVAISPWADLEGTGDSVQTRAHLDKMVSADALKDNADLYAAGTDLRAPGVSPLYGDYTGLPPLLIQVGDAEILLDDSVRVADRAKAAGVDVTLEVWPEMPHVWHAFAGMLPEADQAVARIGEWVRQQIV